MKQKLIALLLALMLALTAAGCGQTGPELYSVSWFDVFDTVTVVQGYADSQEEWNRQMDALHEDLLEYHQLYDIYHPAEEGENLYSINARAGQGPVAADERIFDLLELAFALYDQTGGKLNVAMGSVLGPWHDARTAAEADPEAAALPDRAVLEEGALHRDPASVLLDREAGTIELTDPALQLDVGSIGKGYAVEMAAQAAQARGLTSALLNVGGNLRAIGRKPDGSQWTGGVQDPAGQQDYLAAVYLEDSALVTSGDYQRYFMVDGVRMHHIIDPDTLMPADYCRSVTILTADSGLADGLSTALFCMPVEEGRALIDSLDGVEALWVLEDSTQVESAGFARHVRG